jgi:hypothetical protein
MIPVPDYTRFKNFRNLTQNMRGGMSVPNSYNLPDSKISFSPTPTPKTKFNLEGLKELGQDQQIRSAIGLATNLSSINKMDTNIENRLITNSPFTYTDRSGFLKNRNQASFRNFLNNRTGTPVNDTQAYAATLKADNEIAMAEAQRQDASMQDFNNRNLQINAANIESINRNNYINNTLKNSKLAQKADAYSGYLQNLDLLDLQKNQQNKDLLAIQLLAKAGEQGRATGMYDELLKKLLTPTKQ